MRLAKITFLSGGLGRSIAIMLSGSIAAQALSVLCSPLLTRLYSSEDFGRLAAFSSFVAIAGIVSSLRYELAIPLPKRGSIASDLLVISLIITVVWAALVTAAICLFDDQLVKLFGSRLSGVVILFVPIGVVSLGVYRAFYFWAVRFRRFDIVAKTNVSQALTNVILQSGLGVLGAGAIGLLVGQLCGQIAGTRRLLKFFRESRDAQTVSPRRRRLKGVARGYRKFPIFDAPASLLNALSDQLPQMLFAFLFSPAVAGAYLIAQKVLAAPLALVGQAVGQAIYGNASHALSSGKFGALTTKVFLALLLLILPFALLIFFYAEPIFKVIFGQAWGESGRFASILVIGVSIQFAYSPISMALLATRAQHLNLIIQMLLVLLRVSGILWGYASGSALNAITGYAVGGFIGYSIASIVALRRANTFRVALTN